MGHGRGKGNNLKPLFFHPEPIYSSFRPMFKAVPTMTGNVCSTLACQFIFLALSCTGPRRKVHLNCLLFVHRLAEESRTNACESKCRVINKEHVLAAAKVILKKSRG
ncbi:centromere protein W isoform X4 [Pongo abelii]|uniref:centromere protein W isoform X4 n=1 Tax=Pongo abelii TaxID=9601 RepID=UPI0023E8B0D6|nr:centromere protein W isoform X4 [Pongo abelii]